MAVVDAGRYLTPAQTQELERRLGDASPDFASAERLTALFGWPLRIPGQIRGEALADIESLHDFIAAVNPRMAALVVRRIGRAIETLPEKGAAEPWSRHPVPRVPAGLYVEPGGDIVALLSGRRDGPPLILSRERAPKRAFDPVDRATC